MAPGQQRGEQAAGLTPVVDKTPTPRSSRERIKTLAQAALNADVTVDQLDTLLTGMSDTLTDLNKTMSGMEGTLEYFEQTLQVFNETLARIDELAPRLNAVVDRMEGIVGRVERIVGLSDVVMSPPAATESAVRGMVNAVRRASR